MELRPLTTREVYRNRWMSLREDRFLRPDGSEGLYSVVDKPPFSIIIPHQNGVLHLVQQYRYPVGARHWELPQGTLETDPDADPLLIAQSELAEEVGLASKIMTYLGRIYPAYGLLNQEMHVFVAEDLTQIEREIQPEEQDLVSQAFTLEEVHRMILEGELVDGCTIAALYLWENRRNDLRNRRSPV